MQAYPTLAEVEAATRFQLCRWYRELPSPGMNAIQAGRFDEPEYTREIHAERVVMDRLVERFKECGGFTVEISKAIGF